MVVGEHRPIEVIGCEVVGGIPALDLRLRAQNFTYITTEVEWPAEVPSIYYTQWIICGVCQV